MSYSYLKVFRLPQAAAGGGIRYLRIVVISDEANRDIVAMFNSVYRGL